MQEKIVSRTELFQLSTVVKKESKQCDECFHVKIADVKRIFVFFFVCGSLVDGSAMKFEPILAYFSPLLLSQKGMVFPVVSWDIDLFSSFLSMFLLK